MTKPDDVAVGVRHRCKQPSTPTIVDLLLDVCTSVQAGLATLHDIVNVVIHGPAHRVAVGIQAFFEAALAVNEGKPMRVTSDKAKCYPPALQAVLPAVEHRTSKYLNTAMERDHQHLAGRMRPMRGFKSVGDASTFSRGHALIRNLRCGCSSLPAKVPAHVQLAMAWSARAVNL